MPQVAEVRDVQLALHGSINMLTPLTDEARTWIDDNMAVEGWQWLGGGVAVEPRMCPAIVRGMIDAGLAVFCGDGQIESVNL